MKRNIKRLKQPVKLRNRVEEFLNKNIMSMRNVPPTDIRNLFEEVQIYQVELENINNELQKSQKQLHKSEERLTDFINSATDAFVIFDSKLNIIHVNKNHMELFHPGMDEEDLIGKSLLEIVPNLKETGRFDDFMTVLETGTPYYSDDIVPHKKFGKRYLSLKVFKLVDGLGTIVRDITGRKQAENKVKEYSKKLKYMVEEQTEELRDQTIKLFETNTALKVLMKKSEEETSIQQEQLISNLKMLISPHIKDLKKSKPNDIQKSIVNVLEYNLHNIASSFSLKLSSINFGLTPKELKVADLVRQAKKTQEIAELMGISFKTVEVHRNNIRRKLGLKGRKINLQSYLLSLTN